jgi:hypothetical protein
MGSKNEGTEATIAQICHSKDFAGEQNGQECACRQYRFANVCEGLSHTFYRSHMLKLHVCAVVHAGIGRDGMYALLQTVIG